MTGVSESATLSGTPGNQAILTSQTDLPSLALINNKPHLVWQKGDARCKAQPAPSQPWVAEAGALEKIMCLFRETKCPTMNPIRFHRHMKTRSILNTLCKPPATDEYFILSQQPEQTSSSQHLPSRQGYMSLWRRGCSACAT